MIQYLEHRDINKIQWDACVQESQLPLVYAYSWYLDIVCPGWDALVDGDYEAVFPITWRKKFGIRYVYQPFFTQQLGLFTRSGNQDPKQFLEQIPLQIQYVQICLNESNCEGLHDQTFKPNVTYHLDLSNPYDLTEEGFTVRCRRNLLKAEKGNNLKLTDDFHSLITLFRGNQGRAISGISETDYKCLATLMEECLLKDLGEVWEVRSQAGQHIAGAFVLRSPGRIVYHFAASTSEGRDTGAMYQLISSIIKSYSEQNLVFDFEGSNIEGLARFFKGFGPDPVTYPCIIMNRLPRPIKWLKPSKW